MRITLYLIIMTMITPLLSCFNGLSDMKDNLNARVPVCVNLSVATSGDGRGWTNAFNNLNDAIAAADAGDEIWVANPSSTALPATVNITKQVTLLGGFTGTETRRSQRDLDDKTVITGDIDAFDIQATDVVIDGFSFQGKTFGLGIRVNGASYSATVMNCTFSSNSASGIYLGNGTMEVSACTFSDNSMSTIQVASGTMTVLDCDFLRNINTVESTGGAIYSSGGTLTMDRCTFGIMNSPADGNSAQTGGAMYLQGGSGAITRCNFYHNTSSGNGSGGGAIYADFSYSLTVSHSYFSNNEFTAASGGGGAIRLMNGATLSLRNSLLAGNKANVGTSVAGALYITNAYCTIDSSTLVANQAANLSCCIYLDNTGSPSLSINNSIVWGNTGTATFKTLYAYSNIPINNSCYENSVEMNGASLQAVLCTTADPLFTNAPGGDYTLTSASPCLNTGNNDLIPAGIITDLAGNDRTVGTVDMGCYERQ